jgi:hydrogenase nickel incorporation protein HypA/HybF
VHELSISRNIVAIVNDAAAGRRVRCVTLEIGKRSGVMPHALRFTFDVVVQGTVLEGAELDIRETAGDELKIKTMELDEVT